MASLLRVDYEAPQTRARILLFAKSINIEKEYAPIRSNIQAYHDRPCTAQRTCHLFLDITHTAFPRVLAPAENL